MDRDDDDDDDESTDEHLVFRVYNLLETVAAARVSTVYLTIRTLPDRQSIGNKTVNKPYSYGVNRDVVKPPRGIS